MSKYFYKNLLDHLFDGVYYVGTDKTITYWNPSAEAITGFHENEVFGKLCSDNMLNHIDDAGNALCKEGCPLHESLLDGKIREANVFLHHKDGHRVPVSVRIAPVRDADGNIIGALEVFQDNTAKQEILSELEQYKHMALIDPVTNIGNRKLAEMNLANRFAEMERHGVGFGVLFVDVDHFKQVNDLYGHEAGDKTLQMVSKSMVNSLRSIDVVCRWGGDEFIIIVPNIDEQGLQNISERLLRFVLGSNFTFERHNVCVTVSIGCAIANSSDTDDSIIHRADKLMFKSKSSGGNRYTLDVQ